MMELMRDIEKLLQKHQRLNQMDMAKVLSHVQRETDDWVLNTIMLEGYDVPFIYRRKARYKSLKGARVNVTFYPDSQVVAGIEFEVMNVVRIRRS